MTEKLISRYYVAYVRKTNAEARKRRGAWTKPDPDAFRHAFLKGRGVR